VSVAYVVLLTVKRSFLVGLGLSRTVSRVVVDPNLSA
jgi:hypothetical protein